MYELPALTTSGHLILHTCVKEISDMYYNGSEITLSMIRSYIPDSKIGTNELKECLLYLQEINVIQDLTFMPTISFKLTHFGFCFFEIEKNIKTQRIYRLLCESFLLPLFVSIFSAILTVLLLK